MKKTKKKKKKKMAHRTPRIILPTEKTIMAQNIWDYIFMVYGPPGVGKTEFMDRLSERTLFISTDRGTRYMPALRLEVNTWEDVILVVKTLEQEGARDKYDIIALDHIDDICVMADEYTCQTMDIESLGDAGYAKGWKRYKKNIWALMQRILALDVGLGLISHETIKTIRTKVVETERMMPDLAKSAWKVIVPKCDLVGYCGFKRIKKGGKSQERRVIITSPREAIYAKDRTKRRKPEEGFELLNGKLFAETFTTEGVTKYGKKSKKAKKAKRST